MSRAWRTWLIPALLVGCGAKAGELSTPLGDASRDEADDAAGNDDASDEATISLAEDGGASPDGVTAHARGLLVGYYADWAATAFPVTSIDWTSLTHVAEAFALPQSDGGGLANAATVANAPLVQAAHAHGVKVVVSVGGAHGVFDGAVVDPKARAATVAAIAALCADHAYDGVDIDWEFPDAATVPAWVSLVDDLRTALDAVRPGLTVSTTIGPCRRRRYRRTGCW